MGVEVILLTKKVSTHSFVDSQIMCPKWIQIWIRIGGASLLLFFENLPSFYLKSSERSDMKLLAMFVKVPVNCLVICSIIRCVDVKSGRDILNGSSPF